MNSECGDSQPEQLTDAAKDVNESTVSMFYEDTHEIGHSNGVILEEGITYDTVEFSTEVDPYANIKSDDGVISQVVESASEPISDQALSTEPIVPKKEVSEPNSVEFAKTELSKSTEHELKKCEENSTLQSEIDAIKGKSTGVEVAVPGESVQVLPESLGGGDGYDLELQVVLEPTAGNIELAQLAEMTGDAHTNELLAELQAQHQDFSDTLNGPGATVQKGSNNYPEQEEVLNRKELLDILEGNDCEENNPDMSKNKIDLKGEKTRDTVEQLNKIDQDTTYPTDDMGEVDDPEHEVPEASEEYLVTSCTEVEGQEPNDDTLVALRQLSTLPTKRRSPQSRTKTNKSNSKLNKKKVSKDKKKTKGRPPYSKKTQNTSPNKSSSSKLKESPNIPFATVLTSTSTEKVEEKSQDSLNMSKDLIKVLVEDWDDDETGVEQPPSNTPETASSSKTRVSKHPQPLQGHKRSEQTIDTAKELENDPAEVTQSKSTLSQRRASRVIKKKVIFDPDNPDTFTKSKSPNVTKTKKFSHGDKESNEQPLSKKNKTEITPQIAKEISPAPTAKAGLDTQTPKENDTSLKNKSEASTQKPKVKSSPFIKTKNVTQWKKPRPKNNKQPKRLTEVDRLLMDEGAVNMLYQLNSSDTEVPKGKKNIKSKAAFIKKINQNSTPESNEIKFRERRKEASKSDDIHGREGRLRSSLSNSVASPLVCEEYETHSADDSIIIRRHSSSSYSSSCLSPRRLSDIDAAVVAAASAASAAHIPTVLTSTPHLLANSNGDKFTDIFMSDSSEFKNADKLDKNDCLSLREKLSSKLSRVLNMKRKRDGKPDNVEAKQKKLKDKNHDSKKVLPEFKKLSISFNERVAEILILKEESGNNSIYTIETLKELKSALEHIDRRQEVSVTLLASATGALCGGLDLSSVLQQKSDKKVKAATEIANSVRALFVSMEQHGKLVVAGVEGACVGVGLALLALSDVVVASDRATFRLVGADGTIVPGSAVLTSHRKALFVSLEQHGKLVVAGVEGACVGVGLALLALSDVVVASDRATFSLVGADGTIVPGSAVLTSHRKSLCRSLITEMMVFGRQLSATEALARGLVSRTLWPDRFSSELRAMVQDMAAQPPPVLQLKKRLLDLRSSAEAKSAFASCLDAERDLLVAYWSSDDGQAAIRATHAPPP